MQNKVDYILALEIAGQIPEGKKILGQWNEFIIMVNLSLDSSPWIQSLSSAAGAACRLPVVQRSSVAPALTA